MSEAPGAIHEELRDDLAAYTLGTLEGSDRGAIERHIEKCEPCAEYVAWLRPAAEIVPASVEQIEPPRALRASLLETVRAEAADAGTTRAPAPAQPRRFGLRGFVLRPATGLAAAAVLAAGVFVGYGVFGGDEERSSVQAEAMGAAVGGEFVASLEYGAGGDAILHVERAPDPAPGDVYQAWVSRDGTMEPAASFTPEAGRAEAALGDTLEGADGVFVTEEPSPHEDRPTSEPMMRAMLD